MKSQLRNLLIAIFFLGSLNVFAGDINFSSYKAELTNNNTVLIAWTNDRVDNNVFFEVERSDNGLNFEMIDKTASHISNAVVDKTPLFGKSYYRVKQVNSDGSFSYSKILPVSVDNAKASLTLDVFPNPSNSGQFNVSIETSAVVNLQVFDATGRVAYEMISIGGGSISLDLHTFERGVYYLQVVCENQVINKKIVIG